LACEDAVELAEHAEWARVDVGSEVGALARHDVVEHVFEALGNEPVGGEAEAHCDPPIVCDRPSDASSPLLSSASALTVSVRVVRSRLRRMSRTSATPGTARVAVAKMARTTAGLTPFSRMSCW